MVALAAVGAVCILAEAVVATDGYVETLVNICKAGAQKKENNVIIRGRSAQWTVEL